MFGLFFDTWTATGISPAGIVMLFAGLVVIIAAAGLLLGSPQTQATLRRAPWYQRFEALDQRELHFYGTVALGTGVCSFAGMLTLELLLAGTPLHGWLSPWFSLTLGMGSVLATTIGATLMERAASV